MPGLGGLVWGVPGQGYLLGGCLLQGYLLWGVPAVGGTHPTGMHSCLCYVLADITSAYLVFCAEESP